jgi:sulfatase maturation enzyme AslB (radical SAM superfamily)
MLKDSFCSSPWFHLRLTYDGSFEECRWYKTKIHDTNLADTAVMEFYNSSRMKSLRQDLLDGKKPAGCETCYYEGSFGKLNGRTRQLLKSGIQTNNFLLTARSSPHYERFLHSYQTQGHSDHWPTDLQIDLGNTCNSACIMCDPVASSQLHTEYKRLHKINSTQFANPADYRSWTRNPETLERFIKELITIPDLKYIHFLGGETLYDPAFYTICERLIEAGLAKNIIVGTTTNGTIYDARVEQLITEFKEFHLGISIETVTPLNDYIRYPGKIDNILANIDRFLALRNNSQLYISLRITPNIFTISEIDQVFEYMIEKNVIAESCNILFEPAVLRIELLPDDIRNEIIVKLDQLIAKYNLRKTDHVNIRKSDIIPDVIANVVLDYYQFLTTYQRPGDADVARTQLVRFLKTFETNRQNSILDYAPRYEQFLRHYGY